jgi:hypothetical protein
MELVEKTLKTGKVVVFREATALEEMLAWQMLGDKLGDPDNIGANVVFGNVAIALTVASINGQALLPATKLDEVMVVLAQFKQREWREAVKLYDEINGENDLGE